MSDDMEVQVAAQTRTALQTDLTLRCLLRDKYRHKSRRSADVISWAQSHVGRLSNAVLREVGQQTAGFSIQMNMIQMLGLRDLVYICYDLFLDECDKQVRTEISESFSTERPIHQITRKGDVYIMRRDERVDGKVARQYARMRSIDKGPLPFFSDLTDPPFYNEHGRRIERGEEGYVPVAEMLRADKRRRQEEADAKRRQDEPDDNMRQDKQ
ncbi:hypothetical protein PENFLA_c027G09417 [Penicillium flavigenum]|uniref:Uncharacterized protein n=1 Tax=Penicillium flavigenum TaxID=254877 RepID=A0A1V6SRU8_9EURO|nr:hypothetical protein PENFLA_c027G09417 [Penicillium flavigenum]